AGWTGFAVMMIYAGFDNGTTLSRAYHRFLGVLLGLASGFVLWFIGHLDFRLLIFLIPLTVFFAYFFAGEVYSVPTIFTVNTSLIGTGYFAKNDAFSVQYFLIDYCICTLIAFAWIVLFEYFWFRRFHLMERFIHDTQHEILIRLEHLVELLQQDTLRRSTWFKACNSVIGAMGRMKQLMETVALVEDPGFVVGKAVMVYTEMAEHAYTRLKALYLASYTHRYRKYDYFQLLAEVQADLSKLNQAVRKIDEDIRVSHASSPTFRSVRTKNKATHR
ncbi:MAG: FUSC family protein, partial [Methylococcales bacterium]|nr:FUSC family protein [Methylococcales bacterium]